MSRIAEEMGFDTPEERPLWQLEVAEVTGHNLEARGRKEVNRLLKAGWRLLHIYTLRYEDNGVWRERPMAILGRLKEDLTDARALVNPQTSAEFASRKKDLVRVVSLDAPHLRRMKGRSRKLIYCHD
jgi:hypothetical protein